MISAFDAADALLIAHGAASIEHPGGTLLDHVRRVQRVLAEWNADVDVRLAGLCYAFYGTDGFSTALLNIDQRSVLERVIGRNAESLVYLYGSCDRDYVYPRLHEKRVDFRDRFTKMLQTPDDTSLKAFAEITAANELDVVRHNAAIAAQLGQALMKLFAGSRTHLSVAASQAWANEPSA